MGRTALTSSLATCWSRQTSQGKTSGEWKHSLSFYLSLFFLFFSFSLFRSLLLVGVLFDSIKFVEREAEPRTFSDDQRRVWSGYKNGESDDRRNQPDIPRNRASSSMYSLFLYLSLLFFLSLYLYVSTSISSGIAFPLHCPVLLFHSRIPAGLRWYPRGLSAFFLRVVSYNGIKHRKEIGARLFRTPLFFYNCRPLLIRFSLLISV